MLARVPAGLRRKLTGPQIMHEVLEHRWYLSERRGREVELLDAVDDYVATQLATRPDDSHPAPDITGVIPAIPPTR